MHYRLPFLDGTRESVNRRLDAWLAEGRVDDVENAHYEVRAHLEEATGIVRALGSAEECGGESCTKAGDVEYLRDELDKALEDLDGAEDVLQLLLFEVGEAAA